MATLMRRATTRAGDFALPFLIHTGETTLTAAFVTRHYSYLLVIQHDRQDTAVVFSCLTLRVGEKYSNCPQLLLKNSSKTSQYFGLRLSYPANRRSIPAVLWYSRCVPAM